MASRIRGTRGRRSFLADNEPRPYLNRVTALARRGVFAFIAHRVERAQQETRPTYEGTSDTAYQATCTRARSHLPLLLSVCMGILICGAAESVIAETPCVAERCGQHQTAVCIRADGCPSGCGVTCQTSEPQSLSSARHLPSASLVGKRISIDIRTIGGILEDNDTFHFELLTAQGHRYATVLSELYADAHRICHVMTLSRHISLFQECGFDGARGAELAKRWNSGIKELRELHEPRAGTRDPLGERAHEILQGLLSDRQNPLFLLENGSTLVPLPTEQVGEVVQGHARLPLAREIPLHSCSLPKVAKGSLLFDVCRSALPYPPVSIEVKNNFLVLARQTSDETDVLIQVSVKKAGVEGTVPIALLPLRVHAKSRY